MKNLFSLLLLLALFISASQLTAQRSTKAEMAKKEAMMDKKEAMMDKDKAMMDKKEAMMDKKEATMAKKEAMMDKKEAAMAEKEAMMAKKPTVVNLDQVTGAYTTQSLHLAPGDYIFEVTNTEVNKDLGFYLQDAQEGQVANSGLAALVGKGETSQTGVVTLTEGSYQYSCPLNPTAKYSLEVAAPKVIQLTQTTGEYVQGDLTLAPGQYVFEVTNTEVDKGLGFYLQAADDSQVPASGLSALAAKGETQSSGVVTLTAGTYHYSCPLNPTPHYTITVK